MTKRYDKELTSQQIAALPEQDIDTSDIPERDDAFWANAKVTPPRSKAAISIRLDQDILDWFKAQGPGYQSRINAVLRGYLEAQQSR